MKKRCLVIVGPHGSGKSTLGRRVAAYLGWRFDPELGEELRLKTLRMDRTAHAQRPQPAFDAEVLSRELARDREARGGPPRVVETWHPGNLAYAALRSPDVAQTYGQLVCPTLEALGAAVVVQPLSISLETLEKRCHEPGPEDPTFIAWLHQVGISSSAHAHALGLEVLPALETDACSVPEATAQIVNRLRAW